MIIVPKHSINVLLADDHEIVSEQTINIGVLADYYIVGMADSHKNAVDAYFRLKPDIVLLNFNTRVKTGFDIIKSIKTINSEARSILFTDKCNPALLSNALEAGARGVSLTNTATDRIRVGIECVLKGEVWIDEQLLSTCIVGNLSPQESIELGYGDGISKFGVRSLTERELEVLNLVALGYSNRKIGESLFISIDTVKSHLRRIMEGLSAKDRTDAAVKAVRANLL